MVRHPPMRNRSRPVSSYSMQASPRTEAEEDDPRQVLKGHACVEEMELVDARWLASSRNFPSPLADLISQPGSDADEIVSVSAASGALEPLPEHDHSFQGDDQCTDDGVHKMVELSGHTWPDPELSALLDATPLIKLAAQEKKAALLHKAGDLEGLLHVRRDILGTCKVGQALWSVSPEGGDFLALSQAHYNLALAYADLGYERQAIEHCRWAKEELPQFDHPDQEPEAMAQLQKDIGVLHGDVLLNGQTPRVQEALRSFLQAEGASDVAEVQDMSAKVLCCQALATMGVAQLKAAQATRAATMKLEDELVLLRTKAEAAREKAERAAGACSTPAVFTTYTGKVIIDEVKTAKRRERAEREAQNLCKEQGLVLAAEDEARAEVDLEQELAREAECLFNASLENLFDVTQAEEARLKETPGFSEGVRQHPLMIKLYRQLARIGLNLAAVCSLMGPPKRQDQIGFLKEVLSNHKAYEGTLPHALVAKAYKELGAVYAEDKQYKKAHEVYKELLELQEKEYEDRPSCMAVAQAECYKLKGNVFVAQVQLGRASQLYKTARDLFAEHLGADGHQLVLDLEHRIYEIQEYSRQQQ